jgi:hypothetical protein
VPAVPTEMFGGPLYRIPTTHVPYGNVPNGCELCYTLQPPHCMPRAAF